MKKISIIVPVYNAENYIAQTVDSLLRQTYSNIEILLVNDGSRDNSLSICNMFAEKDKRIIVINQENKGVSVARNEGILHAAGDYITFVDADDWVEEKMCECALLAAEKNEADVVIWSFFSNYPDKQIKCKHLNLESGDITYKKNFLEVKTISQLYEGISGNSNLSAGTTWGKLYRKDLICDNNINFKEGLIRAEDTIFFLYVLENSKKIILIDEYLYHYRISSSSICSGSKYLPCCDVPFMMLFDEYKKFIEIYDKPEEFKVAFRLRTLGVLLWYMKHNFYNPSNFKKKSIIRKEIRETILKEPFRDALMYKDNRFLPKRWKVMKMLLRHKMVFIFEVFYRIKLHPAENRVPKFQ